MAVNRKGRSSQCGATQRAFIEAFAGVPEAVAVTFRSFHPAQEVMPETDGLGGLKMGKARHHRSGMGFRLRHQRRLIGRDQYVDAVAGGPQPQPEIGGHLVIA